MAYVQLGVVGTHLPVLGLALEQHGILGLVDVIWVFLLDLLNVGLCLNAIIFGEGAFMALL